jgi:NAD(P)-dependent dehydrogenase (short-subunit alcohol dehydrogenase family)
MARRRALARSGYAIAVHYRSSSVEAAEAARYFASLGVQSLFLDLTDEIAVRECFKKYGSDLVVSMCSSVRAIWSRNNDALLRPKWTYFDTNALSTFLCSQQAGLRMVDQPEGGCIVTVGDWDGASLPESYAYFVSRGRFQL